MRKLVLAKKSDLEEIIKVSKQAYEPYLDVLCRKPRVLRMSKSDWLELIEKGSIFIIREKSKVIAVAEIKDWDKNNVTVARLSVHPQYQEKGIGSYILKHVEKLARQKGKDVSLATYASYQPAVDFYKKRGYTVRDRKHHKGEDILILRKKIS